MQSSPFTAVPEQHLERPPCPSCGTPMRLVRIDPDKPGHDRRTFECHQCGREQSTVVKFE